MEDSVSGRFRIVPGVNTKVVDGEAVVVDFRSGAYYVLDEVSAFFWAQLEAAPATAQEIQARVLEEFETEPATCAENIQNFFRYLLAEKLVAPVEA